MITVQIENFVDCYPELRVLFNRHHAELGLFKGVIPLEPDVQEYGRRERIGQLFLTTVRRNGSIVAYYVAQMASGLHYRTTLTGHMDIAYVMPEERNRGLAVPLFRHVERELRRRGVKVWYSGYKSHNPLQMDGLLNAWGFIPADVYMVKWIGAGNAF